MRLRHGESADWDTISCLSWQDQGLAWQYDEEIDQCHKFLYFEKGDNVTKRTHMLLTGQISLWRSTTMSWILSFKNTMDDCRQLLDLRLSLWPANQRKEDANKHHCPAEIDQAKIKKQSWSSQQKYFPNYFPFRLEFRFLEPDMANPTRRQHPTQQLVNQIHLRMFKGKHH